MVLQNIFELSESIREVNYLQHPVQTMQITCMCKYYQENYTERDSDPQKVQTTEVFKGTCFESPRARTVFRKHIKF